MKENYTTKDIFEDAIRQNKRVFKLPSLPELGLNDSQSFFQKFESIRKKAIESYNKNCYIEYISLLLMTVEVYLRIFLKGKKVTKYKKKKKKDEDIIFGKDDITFGQIISLCEKNGFDISLINELRYLNKKRTDYIHHYLSKSFPYTELEKDKNRISNIPKNIAEYVFNNVGQEVKSEQEIGTTGDLVYLRK
ncbi:MAG: hypothetical protein IBX72_07505 [Nitrospirae bacterium]|nr:hypothetical protein [Nitrospirota bacterium]